MPTLAVDHASPGEARFTVVAAGAGTVRGVRLSGRCHPALDWETLWSFGGSGTSAAIAVDPGAWLFVAVDATGMSSAVHALIATPDDPMAFRCRSAVADAIRSLALSRIQDRVYERATPLDSGVTYPCVFVHLWDFVERDTGGGTNERTEWEYPTKVLIATRASELDDAAVKEIFGWRQILLEGFDWLSPPDPIIQWTRSEPKLALQRYSYPYEGGKSFEVTGSELVVRNLLRRRRGFPIA